MVDILQQTIKERADKESVLKCPNCGAEMIDNTFIRGSKLAGGAECSECDCKMFF